MFNHGESAATHPLNSMKTLAQFLKTTLIGGLLIVLPIWVTVLLMLKAIKGALALLRPLAKLLPQTVVHEDIVALCLLVVICFVVGLIIRTQPGRSAREWLTKHFFERIPGFSIIRSMVRQMAGDVTEQ